MRVTGKFSWLKQFRGVWHSLLDVSRIAVAIHFASPWEPDVDSSALANRQAPLGEPDPAYSLDPQSSEYRDAA